MAIRFPHHSRLRDRWRAFTLLEVALIVAIIGMMLMMIVGYLLAPKQSGPLPPVAATTPIPPAATPAPTFLSVPSTPAVPATPSAGADAVPAGPTTPAPAFR
ncbi:MAG TPA: hypothetical protein VGM54_19450 [Chthoniobacter sp.]|jgi:hypothetical protein